LGDSEAAAGPLEQAVQSESSIPLIRMFALTAMTLVAIELGRVSKAQEFAQAAGLLGSRSDFRTSPQSGVARIALGAAHAARGRLPEARSELQPVLESRRRLFGISPWPTLELLLLLARVRLDLGDRAGAAELTAEAKDVLTALPDDTQAVAARLAGLERRIAGRPRVVSLAEPLTEREVAVLRLLGSSLSLREIGQELYVSANTVKTHTQAIYRKLGVSTRHDAVEQGKQLGL
jgi:LuxR family maltose regulon positive regulatory protein